MRDFSGRLIGTLLALALIVAGYFGPWVAHKDAALILAADDLAEFIKFMPVVRSGQVSIMRELFFVPIWLGSIGLALFGGRQKNLALKIFLGLLSLIFVLTPLPPFTFLIDAYKSPEFGLTFWVTVAAVLTSVALALLGRRTLRADRGEAILWILFGLAIASIAPLHFIKVQPEIAKLYAFNIGWGFFATIMGGVGLSAIGLIELIGLRRNRAEGLRSIG